VSPSDGSGESTAAQPPAARSLRSEGLRGGLWMAGREFAGLFVRFGGVLVLTRMLGPADYGRFFAAITVVTMLAFAAQLGTEVWLVRRPTEPEPSLVAAVNGVLLASSLATVAAAALVTVAVAPVLDVRTRGIFLLVLVSLPFNILWAPASASSPGRCSCWWGATGWPGFDRSLAGTAWWRVTSCALAPAGPQAPCCNGPVSSSTRSWWVP
jgi:hypothetical protein